MRMVRFSIPALLLVLASFLTAQSKTAPAGHWEGNIKVPSGDLKVVVDLDRDAKGNWIGDIDLPDQGVKDLPVRDLSVTGDTVTFALPAGPGDPKFNGKLSAEGTALSGDFSQNGGSVPFSLTRTGEAKVVVPASSPSLPEKFVGVWEGKIETPGGSLRIVFHFENKDGAAVGSIDSPDQGASGIPISRMTVDGNAIQVGVQIISGEYKGKLSDDGKTISGDWSQGSATLTLVLAKK